MFDRDFEARRSGQPSANLLHRALRHVFHEKTQFLICQRKKLCGVTTLGAKEGDVLVFLFPPWYMPMVLRRVGRSDDYHMVGPAILPSAQRMDLLRRYKAYGFTPRQEFIYFFHHLEGYGSPKYGCLEHQESTCLALGAAKACILMSI